MVVNTSARWGHSCDPQQVLGPILSRCCGLSSASAGTYPQQVLGPIPSRCWDLSSAGAEAYPQQVLGPILSPVLSCHGKCVGRFYLPLPGVFAASRDDSSYCSYVIYEACSVILLVVNTYANATDMQEFILVHIHCC